MGAFLRRLLALFRRSRLERDIQDELAFHRAMSRRESNEPMGGGTPTLRAGLLARERTTDVWTFRWIENFLQDLRIAIRTVAKHPTASLVAVLSLGGGIGSTTATLTILNAVFFNAPPLYDDPLQLTRVTINSPSDRRGLVPGGLYAQWLNDPNLRPSIAAATASRPSDLRTVESRGSSRLRRVSSGLFDVLGIDAAVGRTFGTNERVDTDEPVVISHRVWQNLFGGRPGVIGVPLWIDDRPHTVIGVMPERFWFRSMEPEIWTLLPEPAVSESRLEVIVRRQGATQEGLAEQLQRFVSLYTAALPESERRVRVLVSAVRGTPIGEGVGWLIPPLVVTAVLLTLLIACANVAILMFARWTAREHELAIRSSLGGSRARIMSLLLTESTLVAIVGGLLGVWTAVALRDVIVRNAAAATFFDTTIDAGILIQSAAITILTGTLSGLAPALFETRRLLTNPLRLIASSERVRQRWRHTLVVVEIAVTVALLVGVAGQLEAYRRMLTEDLGFETTSLALAQIEHPQSVDIPRVLEHLRGIPGVASVAARIGTYREDVFLLELR